MATFKERLKELRIEANLSQEQLAEKLRVTKGTIGNYESGKREPRLKDAEAIADLFNVEFDYLFGRTNYKPEFSLEEIWIIKCYRNAAPSIQEGVKSILREYDEKSIFTTSKVG